MLFKSLTPYNIEMPKPDDGERIVLNHHEWRAYLADAAMKHSFKPLAKNQGYGAGWEIPEPDLNQEFLISAPTGALHLLCYRCDERKIPSSAIAEQLKRQVDKIERDEKRKVSKLEKTNFKADIIAAKIPHTLPTPTRILVVMDLDNLTVLIGTSSEGTASVIKAAICAELLPEYEIDETQVTARLLPNVFCKGDAQDHMTHWLKVDNEDMPINISLSDAVTLQRDKSKNIAISGQSMDSQHVQDALNDGYRAFKLPLTIMSGDLEMAEVTLNKYGAFSKIDIPNEFKPSIDDDVEDAQWQLLMAELVRTSLNYHYVTDVVMAAFGGDRLDTLERVIDHAAKWRSDLVALGCEVVIPQNEAENALHDALSGTETV